MQALVEQSMGAHTDCWRSRLVFGSKQKFSSKLKVVLLGTGGGIKTVEFSENHIAIFFPKGPAYSPVYKGLTSAI